MPKAKPYQYETNCVSANGDDITAMVDRARDITYKTLARHCDLREFIQDCGYTRLGLKLKDDWAVSFHKSVYRGRPCYYIDHSRIEYVWVKQVGTC